MQVTFVKKLYFKNNYLNKNKILFSVTKLISDSKIKSHSVGIHPNATAGIFNLYISRQGSSGGLTFNICVFCAV